MKAIVKDNSNNILFRIKEYLKSILEDFKSVLDGKIEATSFDEYESIDFKIVQILKKSVKESDERGNELRDSIGVPSKQKKKNITKTTSKKVVEPKTNVVNPIINRTTNTDRNISLIKGFDNER